jgi:signal transduction histidine kinase
MNINKTFRLLPKETQRESYNEDFITYSLQINQNGILLGAFLFAAYGALDFYMLPQTKYFALVIRFAVVMPIALSILALTYSRKFRSYAHHLFTLCIVIAAMGMLVIIAHSNEQEPGYYHYYSGLLIAIIWINSMMRLRSITSTIVSLAIFLSYIAVAVQVQHLHLLNSPVLLSNVFFLVTSIFIGIFTSRTFENFLSDNTKKKEALKKESDQLKITVKKLEESTLVKNKLLSIIAYDLRSPISKIKSSLNLYSSGIHTPIEFTDVTSKLERSLETTEILLDNLSTWTQCYLKAEVYKTTFNLKITVDQTFKILSSLIQINQISICNELDPMITVSADIALTRLTIRNLVFSMCGNVHIRSEQHTHYTKISIAGSIARTSQTTSNNQDLIILFCKEFIEKQGGLFSQVKIAEKTTFYFTIPKSARSETEIQNLVPVEALEQ